MKKSENGSINVLEETAKTIMIISCVIATFSFMYFLLFYLITENSSISSEIPFLVGMLVCLVYLLWSAPMTVIYYKNIHKEKQSSLAFKICTTIFVNPISGILMLVDNKKRKQK